MNRILAIFFTNLNQFLCIRAFFVPDDNHFIHILGKLHGFLLPLFRRRANGLGNLHFQTLLPQNGKHIVKLALAEGCLHHNGVVLLRIQHRRLCLLRAFQNSGCIAAPAVNALYLRVLAVSGNDDAFALIPRFIHNRVYLLDKRTGAVHHSHALFLQRIIQKLSDTVRTNHNRTLVNPIKAFNDMQSLFVQIPCYLLVMNQRTIGIQRCAVIFFYFRIRHLNRALHAKTKPCGCRQCYIAHSFTFNSSTLSIITFVISPISSVVSFLSRNSSNVSGSP